jgi:hypothetical protein
MLGAGNPSRSDRGYVPLLAVGAVAGVSLGRMTVGEVLFELAGVGGDGVRVVLGEPFAPNAADLDARSWVHARIEVRAHPFTGTIETVFVPEQVAEWRNAPRLLRDG